MWLEKKNPNPFFYWKPLTVREMHLSTKKLSYWFSLLVYCRRSLHISNYVMHLTLGFWEFLLLSQNVSAVWSFGHVRMDWMTLNTGRISKWFLTNPIERDPKGHLSGLIMLSQPEEKQLITELKHRWWNPLIWRTISTSPNKIWKNMWTPI